MYLKLNRASFRVLPLGNGLASHIARHLLRVVVTSRAPMAGGAVPVCQCSAQQEQALRKAIDKTTLRKEKAQKNVLFCTVQARSFATSTSGSKSSVGGDYTFLQSATLLLVSARG